MGDVLNARKGWQSIPVARVHYLLRQGRAVLELAHMHELIAGELFSGMIQMAVDSEDEESEEEEEDKEEVPFSQKRRTHWDAAKLPSISDAVRATLGSADDAHKKKKRTTQPANNKKRRKGGDGSERAEEEKAFLERQRSDMWTEWGKEAFYHDSALGWVPVSFAHNDVTSPIYYVDKLRPIVVNLFEINDIVYRVNIEGQYEWQFRRNKNEAPLENVFVFGTRLPFGNMAGTLKGDLLEATRVARVLNGWAFALYQSKANSVLLADAELAMPGQVTQENPAAAKGQEDTDFEAQGQPTAAPYICNKETIKELALKRAGVTEEQTEESKKAAAAAQSALGPNQVIMQLNSGQVFAANRVLPKAPEEVFVARQAFLESVCEAWEIPMSLVSQGDATGKIKLNTSEASPDSARLFKTSQATRKHWIEKIIARMWFLMYGEHKFAQELEKQTQGVAKTRVLQEDAMRDEEQDRLALEDGTKQEEEEEEKEDDQSSMASSSSSSSPSSCLSASIDKVDFRVHARIRVSLPVRVSLPDLAWMHEHRVLKWEAERGILSKEFGLPLESFQEEEPESQTARAASSNAALNAETKIATTAMGAEAKAKQAAASNKGTQGTQGTKRKAAGASADASKSKKKKG